MLRLSPGYSPDYLLKEVAAGRENYYTGAVAEGEPPGRWWGAGAEKLGLAGLVDAQDMRAVYERFLDPREEGFSDPDRWGEVPTLGHTGRRYATEDDLYSAALEREPDASAERRAELRTEAGKAARHNVAFLDATFSVQKSVTLLHTAFEAREVAARAAGNEEEAAAWGEFRAAVEDAIWAGNNAGLTYMAEKAGYSRVGHHGGAAGRFVDAHDWVVGSFFQHDSRDRDPQLHIHNAILNRVQGPDGEWRTLDSRGIHRWRAGAGAVAERTTEERLTHALGMVVATRPDGKAREVVGVDAEAMSLISSRRHAVTAKAAELIETFEQRYGRAPNGVERDRLAQQATLVTRAAKSHDGETRAQLLDRVEQRLRADIDGGLAGVADTALAARADAPTPMAFHPQSVIEVALEDVRSRKAGWTRSDLTRAINAALPDYLGTPDGAEVSELLDQLTEQALTLAVPMDAARPGAERLPAELRLANGQSAYDAPGGAVYSTPEQVRSERILLAATTARDGAALTEQAARRFLDELAESGIELGADQATAVSGILTSGARVETLVGPAGTGKSFVVGALARAWTDPTHQLHSSDERADGGARRVFGLATSQVATEVLTAEGLTARNVTQWLGSQERLTAGAAERRPVDADRGWALHAGDLVVVDESAMTDTAALSAVHQHCEAAGAKLLLVGDHRQLAAVGAGGGMDLLAAAGSRYELAEARRFTAEWERDASLRLRNGDEGVLRDYHQQGRLRDAGTAEQAEHAAAAAWLGDTLAGRRSLLLVDTNEQAARLSAGLRAALVRLGRVDEHGVALAGGTFAGGGDLVQARHNGWELAGVEGNRRGPINRETYQVTAVRDDGALEVSTTPRGAAAGERMVLPADYVGEHLALGYASTVHAAQGATVDTTHSVITGRTGPAALYVAMSRGRESNTAHVATLTGPDDAADGSSERHSLHRDPVAALAAILDASDQAVSRSAVAIGTESAETAASTRTAAELLADAAQLAATERTATSLDRLAADGALTPEQRSRVAAEDGAASLTRILRRAELAGHDPHAVLAGAVERGPLTGSRHVTNVIYSRIQDAHRFDPVGETWASWVPRTDNPEWRDYLDVLAEAADRRAAELGVAAAAEPPAWATAAFGEVPEDSAARETWQQKVGQVAAHREMRDHDDAAEALGPAPQPGQVEQFASYRAAWRTLGRPEIDREHLELSNGQLRMRVRAYERELAAAPRYVGNELAGTRQTAEHHRQSAALRQAEADAATEPAERDRLAAQAGESAALARTLDERAEQLQQVDDARARWLAHTAETRAQAELSKAELAARDAADDPDERVTAAEWKAAHAAAVVEDERDRAVTEADLDPVDRLDNHAVRTDTTDEDSPCDEPARPGEVAADYDADHSAREVDDPAPVPPEPAAAETARPDLREQAAAEPRPVAEDVVRVPDAEEAATSVDRAGQVIEEIRYRESAEQVEEADHRAHELARWHADDQAADTAAEETDALDDAPALDGAGWGDQP